MQGINPKHQSRELLQSGLAFLMIALVLLGIGGTIYKAISPGGWVAQAFGQGYVPGLLTVGALVTAGVVLRLSTSRSTRERRTRFADVLAYAFAAAGLAYALDFLRRGGW
jgi:hypothetical protein